jgi:hypothetical protein
MSATVPLRVRTPGPEPTPDPAVPVATMPVGSVALRLIAAVLLPVALALDPHVISIITGGMIAVFGLAPVWLPHFIRSPKGTVLLLAGVAFVGAGFIVGWASRIDHTISMHVAVTLALTYAMYIGGVGALVWASRVIGITGVVLVYAGTLLMSSLLHPASWAAGPWKHGFALPVALIVLALLDRQQSTGVKLIGLGVLAAVSILNDYRSAFAMFLVAGLILSWQRLRRNAVREPSIATFMFSLLVVGGTVYYTVTRLLVSGALGAGLKAKSDAQVETSGSLLLGGRPEWTVTIRLFRERPWGFGFGAVPSPADYELGRQGFASIHLSEQENYLKHYVFDQVFRLHSITADLWAAAGVLGLALVLVVVWILVSTLATELAHRTTSALRAYVTLLALWNIGFSPVYSNFPEVMLALAVALAATGPPGRTSIQSFGRQRRAPGETIGSRRPGMPAPAARRGGP